MKNCERIRVEARKRGQAPVTLKVTEVAYAPDVRRIILSVFKLAEKGTLHGEWGAHKVGMTLRMQDGTLVGTSTVRNGLYTLDVESNTENTDSDSSDEYDIDEEEMQALCGNICTRNPGRAKQDQHAGPKIAAS